MNESDRKWNLMWDMWVAGDAESPYAELMEYESEVNNGGHSQYFYNFANCGDLKAEVEKIAELKMKDLNAASLEAATSMIAGTARSMGIEVVD